MKHAALALVLFAMACTAQAGGTTASSLLRCGVIFGGKSLTYDAGDQAKNQPEKRLDHLPANTARDPLRFSLPATERVTDPAPTASNTSDQRLPRKLTLATIGCAW